MIVGAIPLLIGLYSVTLNKVESIKLWFAFAIPVWMFGQTR